MPGARFQRNDGSKAALQLPGLCGENGRGHPGRGQGEILRPSLRPCRQQPARLPGGRDTTAQAAHRALRCWARRAGKERGPEPAEEIGARTPRSHNRLDLRQHRRPAVLRPGILRPGNPRPLSRGYPRPGAGSPVPAGPGPPRGGAVPPRRGGCSAFPAAAAVTGRAGRAGLLRGGGGAARGPAASPSAWRRPPGGIRAPPPCSGGFCSG